MFTFTKGVINQKGGGGERKVDVGKTHYKRHPTYTYVVPNITCRVV